MDTPQKFNIDTQNDGFKCFKDVSPFKYGYFWYLCSILGGIMFFQTLGVLVLQGFKPRPGQDPWNFIGELQQMSHFNPNIPQTICLSPGETYETGLWKRVIFSTNLSVCFFVLDFILGVFQGCRFGPESSRQTLVSPIFRSLGTICGGLFPTLYRGQIYMVEIRAIAKSLM